MKKRVLAMMLSVVMVSTLFTGCSSDTNNSVTENEQTETEIQGSATAEQIAFADTNGDGKVMVGFSAVSFSDNWMVNEDEAMKKKCKELGFEYTSQGAEGVSATQVNQMENMITLGCDWIYATIFDPDALEAACRMAEDNKCHVIYIGVPYEDRGAFYAALTGSQYDYGYKAMELADAWVNEKYPDAAAGSIECAIFMNSVSEDFVTRANAMKEIEKVNPKVKIVEVYDLVGQDASAAKCQEYTDQLFMKHPDCKLIISHSSDFANAIDEVVMRTPGLDTDSIAIFSDDWLEAAGNAVRSSEEGKSVFRGFVASGEVNDTVMKMVTGEVLPNEDGTAMLGMYSFTAKNIDEAFAMFAK